MPARFVPVSGQPLECTLRLVLDVFGRYSAGRQRQFSHCACSHLHQADVARRKKVSQVVGESTRAAARVANVDTDKTHYRTKRSNKQHIIQQMLESALVKGQNKYIIENTILVQAIIKKMLVDVKKCLQLSSSAYRWQECHPSCHRRPGWKPFPISHG